MMKFSRPSTVDKTPVSLSRVLDKSIDLANNDYDLKKNYDFRHIAIIKDYQEAGRPLYCIETEIEQVIFNLLKNAAQAIAAAKNPSPAQITLRSRDEGLMIKIEVEDNGPGMDKEVQRRVFEPFYTTKPIGEGTGLGLSVSYMIITSIHQGIMEVQSEIGKGSRFIIKLPINPPS